MAGSGARMFEQAAPYRPQSSRQLDHEQRLEEGRSMRRDRSRVWAALGASLLALAFSLGMTTGTPSRDDSIDGASTSSGRASVALAAVQPGAVAGAAFFAAQGS